VVYVAVHLKGISDTFNDEHADIALGVNQTHDASRGIP
jgi:hypothetical protein